MDFKITIYSIATFYLWDVDVLSKIYILDVCVGIKCKYASIIKCVQ